MSIHLYNNIIPLNDINNTQYISPPKLHLLAWETTRRCNLNCLHCRAGATNTIYPNELNTKEAEALLTDIRKLGQPIIILTGGEPLLRKDIYHLINFGIKLGLRMVIAINGTLLTEKIANRLKKLGIKRISISLDGPNAQIHDSFRGQPGAFNGALKGITIANIANIEVQINTTITRTNLPWIKKIYIFAKKQKAVAHHIFLLVPIGRGYILNKESLTAQEYEDILNWFVSKKLSPHQKLELKATCAPHFYRILRQEIYKRKMQLSYNIHGLDAITRGCLGGINFAFINHIGQVQPCGYLEFLIGNIRTELFSELWQKSKILKQLRDYNQLKGKCGICLFRKYCGGCRARAFIFNNDIMAEEPLCIYSP